MECSVINFQLGWRVWYKGDKWQYREWILKKNRRSHFTETVDITLLDMNSSEFIYRSLNGLVDHLNDIISNTVELFLIILIVI